MPVPDEPADDRRAAATVATCDRLARELAVAAGRGLPVVRGDLRRPPLQ